MPILTSPSSKTVLITGASSGIGEATAALLTAQGYHVYAGVRQVPDAQRLQAQYANLTPLILDVTQPETIQRGVAQLTETLSETGLYGLINNAGIVVGGPLECLTEEALRHQLDVNVVGVLTLTNACLPLLRQGGEGRIINISSIAGVQALPYIGAYSISKFALEALSDVMRLELKPWNIKVSVIQPGAVVTPIWEKSLQAAAQRLKTIPETITAPYTQALEKTTTHAQRSSQTGASPQQVAYTILTALGAKQPKPRYTVGCGVTLARWATWLPEALQDAIKQHQL